MIDAGNTIHYLYGDTDRYLSFPRGEAEWDLIEMASGQLYHRLSQSLEAARGDERSTTLEGISIQQHDRLLEVDVSITPVNPSEGADGWLLVEFHEKSAFSGAEERAADDDDATAAETAELKRKLHHTRQELQATVEELETSNEELKSSNEELQANNEELQSTNEELESSKEELQSTNEELETVNSELHRRNQELEKAENDLRNLFAAVENAIILLDEDLRIQRFTPSATRIFNLKDVDIGRKLSDISSNLEYGGLEKQAEEVLDRLERKEATVRSREGRIYQMRITPYRTSKNRIDGVVLSFFDVSRVIEAERGKTDARSLFADTITALWEPILILDDDLMVQRANPPFFEAFKTSADETLDHPLYQLGDGQWDIPELRRFLEEIIPQENEFKGYVVEHDFPRIGRRKMSLSARKIHEGEDRPSMILMGFKEVTEENGR